MKIWRRRLKVSNDLRQVQELAIKYEPWSNNYANLVCIVKSYCRGRIETYKIKDKVVGYVETWRLEKSQMENVLNGKFSVRTNNTTEGPILWIANITIDEPYRNDKKIVRTLKKIVFKKNKDAELVGGEYNGTRKRHKNYKLIPMRVMKRMVIRNGK